MMPWPQCRRSDALRKEGEAKLAAQQAEIEELRARLGEFTKDGVVLTPRPAWTDGEGGEGRSAERVDALRRVLETERERANVLEGEGAEAKRGREEERAKCVLAEEGREKAQARNSALEDEVSPKIPQLGPRAQTEMSFMEHGTDILRVDIQVKRLSQRPVSHSVGVGCPESGPGFEQVEVSEYLEGYLSKRFGNQTCQKHPALRNPVPSRSSVRVPITGARAHS